MPFSTARHLDIVSALQASAAAVSLVTGVGKTVTSIAVPVGVWDIRGWVGFTGNSGTTVNAAIGGANNVTNALSAHYFDYYYFGNAPFAATNLQIPVPIQRVTLLAPATWYLVALATFGVDICKAYGYIEAVRA